MKKLYNYIFHYNPHTEEWNAIPRELTASYWNDRKTKGVIRSKSIDTLIHAIVQLDSI